MTLLRYKDLEKMEEKSIRDKMQELKLELSKANVAANRQNAKTKEIKKAISRIMTLTKFRKNHVKKK